MHSDGEDCSTQKRQVHRRGVRGQITGGVQDVGDREHGLQVTVRPEAG